MYSLAEALPVWNPGISDFTGRRAGEKLPGRPFQLHRKLSGIYRQLRHVRSAYSDFVQLAQVVLPILPAVVGYAAGAVLFGWAGGFFCNYIGISIGSLLAFYLARRYGAAFVQRHVSSAAYDKYFHWTHRKKDFSGF